jgi:hypothetical protein
MLGLAEEVKSSFENYDMRTLTYPDGWRGEGGRRSREGVTLLFGEEHQKGTHQTEEKNKRMRKER